jgi:hypothetical protein
MRWNAEVEHDLSRVIIEFLGITSSKIGRVNTWIEGDLSDRWRIPDHCRFAEQFAKPLKHRESVPEHLPSRQSLDFPLEAIIFSRRRQEPGFATS